jgi:protein SCO1/2
VTRDVTKGTRITPDQVVADVRIDQKLNNQLPLDTPFQDEAGRAVTLRDAIGNKPAVFVMLQYRCPMLCGLMMEGLNRRLPR